jgi:predicted Zn-dependent peptidase
VTLVTERAPQFQSLSVGAWVSAGTRHEREGQEGLAHFLEHMMFKGTERRSALDIALAVDRAGGEFNAFTSREYTCFHILSLSRDIKLALDIMSDVLLNSKFAEEEIDRERKVILQEIAMVEDNPEELIHDLFFEQAFGGHALGRPILGKKETVARFDRPTVYSYFKRHYSPKDLVISVAGDINHDDVRRLLERQLGSHLPGGKNAGAPKPNLGRPRIATGARAYRRDLEQTHFVLGFPSVSNGDPDRFAAYLLNIYLGGGMSSSLFQEIREKRGLAYTIYSSLSPFSDAGLFSIYVATSPSEVGICLDVVGREVKKIREGKLDPEALQILKENLKGTILLNLDSVESRMTVIAKNEMFFGRYYSTGEMLKMIDKVTAQDVARVARNLFKPKNLILSMLGPSRLSPRRLASFCK